MQLRRLILVPLALVALGALFLSGGQDALAATATIKFFAAEYRVTYAPGPSTTDEEGNRVEGKVKVELDIRGRASAYGGDKVDFKWTEPDAERWLPVLQVCGGGQGKLQGEISSQVDQNDRGIEGSGPIDELNCRIILK